MFFWALHSMTGNARIIFLDHPDTPKLSHEEFWLRCACTLINAAVFTASPPPGHPQQPPGLVLQSLELR
jgi:hypothetical protein